MSKTTKMASDLLSATILAFLLSVTLAKKTCDISKCNHEAVCIEENGKPTCECVPKLYEGDFCTVSINHCSSNPCQNGGTCHPYPGHYFCECIDGYAAQRCTSKQDTFKGIHLHYNHIAAVGVEHTMLLVVKELGGVETILEFFTPDYLIDGFTFTNSSGHFKSSKNLISLGKSLRIRHSDSLPFKKGFYRKRRAIFWTLGLHTMAINLLDAELTAENFFTQHFNIFVYDPSGVQCLPIVHLTQCTNPRKALHMDIVTFNFVEPIVDQRCANHSQLKIKWSVRNYIDSVILHKFPERSSTVLTIFPYTMWFNYQDEFVQSYLIKGDVRELDQDGNHLSRTVLRCYVFVDSKPTTAHILGGNTREVNINKGFEIDGSSSRDYARTPRSDQHLQYRWSCKSEDVKNRHCTKAMGKGSRIYIPARAFKLNQIYEISLQVRSTINIYSSHRTFQNITPVSTDPLLLNFHCLRNCEHDKFATGKVIHLRIDCINCPSGHLTHSVRNEQNVEISTSHNVILTENTNNEVSLKATSTLGSRQGLTVIKLGVNNPPSKGTCNISPSSGSEYETVFKISCQGYVDDELPIDYKFSVGNTTLHHSGKDTFLTRLFPTSGQNCDIHISICDDIGACTEVTLQATLSPITPSSWLDFMTQNGSNLNQLIEDGDRSAAITLIGTVITHMPSSEAFQIAKYIVESIRHLEVERLLATEQVLAIAGSLFSALDLSSETVIFASELFEKVSKGLLHSIKNEEVIEFSQESYSQMIAELSVSMAKASIDVEIFPITHDAELAPPEDQFQENYPDYGEFDAADVVRISNWLQSFNRMHRCLQIMGVVSAFIQLPDESPVLVQRKGITSKTLVIDNTEPVSLSWNESQTYISFPTDFFQSLCNKEIAFQVTIFEVNPFWWSPEQYKLNTEVLSVGMYTKDLKSLKSNSRKKPFNFFMALKDTTGLEETNVTKGTIENSGEILLYEKKIPANAVLVVKFMSVSSELEILLTVDQTPRSYMFKDAEIIKASETNKTFTLVNTYHHESRAFLAIKSESQTSFSFAMYNRLCLTWSSTTHEWISKHCSVGSQTNATHIHCSCWHLSMFGAKIHPTFAHPHAPVMTLNKLPFNYKMLSLLLVAIGAMCLFILLAWCRDKTAILCPALVNGNHRKRYLYKYRITIYTNGHTTAATSSNVTIQLHGSFSDSEQYTVYPKRGYSLFQQNFKLSFATFSPTSLGVLQYITLHHDSFGRYPSWNCNIIRIRDEFNRKEYVFLAKRWLSDYKSTSCTVLIPLSKKSDIHTKTHIFRETLTDAFTNWYCLQAVCPQRLFCNFTAMEKTTIFVLKVCLTIMGTLIIFGPTDMFTYELEREKYDSMLQDFGDLFIISVGCHIVASVAAVLLSYLFVQFRFGKVKMMYNPIYYED